MKFQLRNNRDFLAGLLFFAIGAVAMVVARDYPMGSAMRMGAGYFPTVLAGILCAFGAWLMVRGAASGEKVKGEWGWKPLGCITLSIVLFGLLMPRLGLIPALVAMFFVSAAGGREFRFKEVLALSAVMSVFAAGVFLHALKLPYPMFGSF